jgi:hypothetical protein
MIGNIFMMVKSSKCKYSRSALFISISTLIILIGGSVTMVWQLNRTQSSQAASSSIIGPPSLPAATVDSILRRVGSPMAGTGKIIEQAARATNIDDAFALGVWWTETNDGEAGVGLADRNPGSVRGSPGYPAAFDGYTIYPSYAAAVTDWFNILRSRYVNEGLTSVYAICHPYVGTSSASLWAAKVVNLMVRYQGEAPPPAPTVVVTPTKTPLSAHNHRPIWLIGATPVATTASVKATPTVAVVPTTQPVQAAAHAPAALNKQPQVETRPQVGTLPISKTLPVGVSLLAALLIGCWGLKIRRNVLLPAEQTAAVAWQANEAMAVYPPLYVNEFSPVLVEQQPFPGLYVNEFSPVLEQQPSPILSELADRQTDEFAFPEVEQLSFPGLSPWIPVASQVPEPVKTGAGLLSRYRNAELAAVGAARLPERSPSDMLAHNSDIEHSPTTEMLSLPGMKLPGRQPVPVRVRSGGGGGLLSRYANERQ